MLSYQMAREAEENLLSKIVNALTGGRDAEGKSSKKKLNKNFCVEDTLSPADIKVTVKEVGKLSFPLSNAYIQKLINISTSAKFGMGEKTVLDKNFRDTQMIESKNLNVTINKESLSRITSNMQKVLNLPENSTLTPHLHNMLIYGPGQFFNKHRDSEKLQNMVATLVIVLPSPHVGGDLTIEHGKKKHIFSTESVDEKNARCICFFSDCWHKVNKVKSGYRVALTYNVVLETGELTDTACNNEELKAAMQDYFNNAIVKDRSKKIVFFLNHTYSEHSLGWSLLKGEDCQYASSFRSVAQELDLDVHLVLANIRQCWSSASEYRPKPDWLVESESTLDCWIDANNAKLSYGKYSTVRSEICFARETHYSNFDPTEEEFSGPTGNEGSTVDYWYKRAAVVLWQKSDSVMIKFELNHNEAMAELCTLISAPGNEQKVKEILDKAAKLVHKDSPKVNDFERFVNIALYVKKKNNALAILSPFCSNVLIPKHAGMLVQLQQQYGTDWLIELIEALRHENRYAYSWDSSVASEAIYPLALEFLSSGGDKTVIESLLNVEVTTFIKKSAQWNSSYHSGRADDLERPRELFKACATIGNAELQEKLAQHLSSQPKSFVKNDLVKLYHHLQTTLSPESSENFEPLRTCLGIAVKQELPSQARPGKDWSIPMVLSCSCEHCNILTDFLHSKTNIIKSWSANGTIRKHVMSALKQSKAPVNVTLEREKIPFTMVLEKNASLLGEAAGKSAELKTIPQTPDPKTGVKKRQPFKKNDGKKRQKL